MLGFAVFCPLAHCRRPPHPVLVHRLAPLLHASFRPRLATTPLRFAITSPPSGCEKDFHLRAVEHARHTRKRPDRLPDPARAWIDVMKILSAVPGLSLLSLDAPQLQIDGVHGH